VEQRRQCPGCKASFKVPEAAAAKSVRCPRCQTVIPPPGAVAAKAGPAAPASAAGGEGTAARRAPARAPDGEGKNRPAKGAVPQKAADQEIDETILARGRELSLRLEDFSAAIQEKIHAQLTPQEQIVWVGRTHRGARLPLLLLMLVLALAIGVLLLLTGSYYQLPTVLTLLFSVGTVVAFVVAESDPLYRVVFPSSICYVLTSRRALACVQYPFWSFSRTQVFGFQEGPSAYPGKQAKWPYRNVGTLFMGDAIFLPIEKLLGMTKISRVVYGFVGIDNLDEVDQLVRDTLQPRSKSKTVWPKPNKAFVVFGFVVGGVLLAVMGGIVALIFMFGGGPGERRDYYKEAIAEREQKAREANDAKIRQVAWKVRPDPGSALPAPGNATSIPAGGGTVVFPGSPAGFVAVNQARNPKEYGVYDLSSGRLIGKPHALKIAEGTRPALSQDGQTLALRVEGRTDLVEVRDVQRRNRPLHVPFKKDGDAGFAIGDLRFVSKDRLVVVLQKGQGGREARTIFAVFNVASKKHESRFDGSFSYDGRRAAFSPGGNFLVMHPSSEQNFLFFWDLRNGQVVGTLEISEPSDPKGETAGLAFSPDGKSVALLWKMTEKGWGRVLCWDLDAHKRVGNHPLEQAPPGADTGGRYALQFLPDSSGVLLFGHLIIDRAKGTATGKVGPAPASAADAERVVVDQRRVSRLMGGARSTLQFLNLPGMGE
jgi:predicted Zn finger-like uncharacterized protein